MGIGQTFALLSEVFLFTGLQICGFNFLNLMSNTIRTLIPLCKVLTKCLKFFLRLQQTGMFFRIVFS